MLEFDREQFDGISIRLAAHTSTDKSLALNQPREVRCDARKDIRFPFNSPHGGKLQSHQSFGHFLEGFSVQSKQPVSSRHIHEFCIRSAGPVFRYRGADKKDGNMAHGLLQFSKASFGRRLIGL